MKKYAHTIYTVLVTIFIFQLSYLQDLQGFDGPPGSEESESFGPGADNNAPYNTPIGGGGQGNGGGLGSLSGLSVQPVGNQNQQQGFGPGAHTHTNYNVPVPIKPPPKASTSTITGNPKIQEQYFELLAEYLTVYNPNTTPSGQTCLKNLMLALLQYYWEFDPETAQSDPTKTTAPLPLTIDEALSGQQGRYFFMAFAEDSYPVMLLGALKNILLQYIRGRTNQLNVHFYASQTADNFIAYTETQGKSSKGKGKYSGQLAELDAIWNEVTSDFSKAFTHFSQSAANVKGGSQWIKSIEVAIDKLLSDYALERDKVLVEWYFNLVNDLAFEYNHKNFQIKSPNFSIIPNPTVLAVYEPQFTSALSSLVDRTDLIPLAIGPYSFNPNYSSSETSSLAGDQTKFSKIKDFTAAVVKNVNLNLANISTYAALINIEKAEQLAAGKELPLTLEQLNPLEGSYENVATLETFGSSFTPAGKVDPQAPLTSANITSYPQFSSLQNQFQELLGQIENLMDAFGFGLNNSIVWSQQLSQIPTGPLPWAKFPSGSTPASIQKKAVTNFVASQQDKHSQNSNTSNTAKRIFDAIELAQKGFVIGAEYFEKAGQSLWAKYYQRYADYITIGLRYFEQAIVEYEEAQTLKKFEPAGSKAETQGNAYFKAQDAFGQASTAFRLLRKPALITYCRKLSAQLGMLRYESVLAGYTGAYQPWIARYIDMALTDPGYKNKNYSPTTYQNYLDGIFGQFDLMLPGAIQSYEEELAFYFALHQAGNIDNEEDVAQLQAAIKVFSNLYKAMAGIYHCLTNAKGDEFCEGKVEADFLKICWLNNDISECLGADNYIESAVAGTQAEVIDWVLFANHQYLIAQPYFKKIDELFEKYPTALEGYTQIKSLFTSTTGDSLSFSEFFFLHQARLYISIGQRIQWGLNWAGKKKRKPSSTAMLLYLWARALYVQGGFDGQVTALDNVLEYLKKKYPQDAPGFYTQAKSIIAEARNETKVGTAQQYFEEAIAYYITSLKLGDITVIEDFLTLISSDIMKPADRDVEQGIAEWLAGHQAEVTFAKLSEAWIYYCGYLVAYEAKSDKASDFFNKAASCLQQVYDLRASLTKQAQFSANGPQLTDTIYKQKVAAFERLLKLNKEIEAIELKAALYRTLFEVPKAQNLQWQKEVNNISYLLGQLYQKGADELLWQEEENFATGKNYTSKNQAAFEAIIDRYSNASQRYAEAEDQAAFASVNIDLTNTIAFQAYSSVLPVNHFTLPTATLKNSSNQPKTTTDNSIPHPKCTTAVPIDTAMKNFNPDTPLYLFRYDEQRLDSQYFTIAKQLAGKTDLASMEEVLDKIVIPMHTAALEKQSNGSPSADVSKWVALYKKQFKMLLTTGVNACGQLVKGKATVKAVPHKSTGTDYILELTNRPLPPIPSFTGELLSAFTIYGDGPLKLYGSGENPIHFAGRMLTPSNNKAGQQLVKDALLNTYLSYAVPTGAKIYTLQNSAKYKTLQGLSGAERVTAKFSDYSDLYKELNSAFTDLVSTYDALNTFLMKNGEDTAIGYSLCANAFLEWEKALGLFTLGDPTNEQTKGIVKLMSSYATQVAFYSGYLKDKSSLALEAETVFINALVELADSLTTLDVPPTVTQYPSNSSYPVAVPGFDTLKNWKGAFSYYSVAAAEIANYKAQKANAGEDFSSLDALLVSIQVKEITVLTKLAAYHLARFGYNAFMECKCSLSALGKALTPVTAALIQTPSATNGGKSTDSNDTVTEALASSAKATSFWDLIKISTIGLAGYPAYRYGFKGYYPQEGPTTTDSFGNTIRHCPADGKTFRLIVADTAEFQGVASIEQPTFQTILKSGQVGVESSGFSNWQSGAGASNTSDNINKAYIIMKNDCLFAMKYLDIASDVMEDLAPTPPTPKKPAPAPTTKTTATGITGIVNDVETAAVQAAAKKAKEASPEWAANTLNTLYLATIFTKAPAFGSALTSVDSPPVIFPPTEVINTAKLQSDKGAAAISSKERGTEQMKAMMNYLDTTWASWTPLSLSNRRAFYPHTLRYWASNATFGPDITTQFLTWLGELQTAFTAASSSTTTKNKQIFSDVTRSWIDQLTFLARDFYSYVYLPGVAMKDAFSDIDTALQNIENQTFLQASEYVG